MKLLFVCTTEFQLITALNIKYHMHPDDDADIIVDNYHGEEKELAERIRETKLFRKVFYVRSYIEHETLHKYFRSISDGEPGIGLAYAIKNSLLFLKMRIMTKIFGSGAYIGNMLAFSENFSIEEYDAFLAYGDKPITCALVDILSRRKKDTKVFLLDEGTGTYVVPNIGKHSNLIDGCYVYAPDLVIYAKETYKVPPIKQTDYNFIAILNYVFQFHTEDVEDYSESIIVFNQSGRGKMPKYLQNPSWIVRLLFHNSYKRHIEEEKEYEEQAHLMRIAIEYASNNAAREKTWMKLNPRAAKSTIEEYKASTDTHIIRRYDLPWELVALNCSVQGATFLTNCSSAVCLYNAVLEKNENVRCVLLYKLGKNQTSEKYNLFFEKLAWKYENVCIPEDTFGLKQCNTSINCVR